MLWFCTFLIPAYNASSRVSVVVRFLNWHTKVLVSPRSIHLLILYNRPTYSSSISIACFVTAFRRVTYPVQTSVLPPFKSFLIPPYKPQSCSHSDHYLPHTSVGLTFISSLNMSLTSNTAIRLAAYNLPTYPPLKSLLTSIQAFVLSLYNHPAYSFQSAVLLHSKALLTLLIHNSIAHLPAYKSGGSAGSAI